MAASCKRETLVERANREGIFLVGNSNEPQGVDPHLVSGVIESKIITSIFEGLIADHPYEDGTAVPGVAERWEPNETKDVWTFHLRRDNQWSDGTPLTANDFLFAWERMLTPELGARYADMLYLFIRGAEDFNQGKTRDFSTVGVSAPDPYTLVVELVKPTPFLPFITRHYTWFPVPEHVIMARGNGETRLEKMTDRGSDWTHVEHFAGNGPFQLKSWRFGDYIEVERNPRYWDAETVGLNGIRFIAIQNPYTETRTFLAGGLHTTYSVPAELVPLYAESHPQYLRQEPYVGTMFLRFNVERGPLTDPRVRKALSMALDREAIVRNLMFGFTPASSITPPMGDYIPPEVARFDPEEARRLLAEAGYPDGKGFPSTPLELLTASIESSRTRAEVCQAMWKEHLGLDIALKMVEWTTLISTMQQRNFEINSGGWIGDYLDPSTFLFMWTKDNGNNNTNWWSAEYEEKLRLAGQESDASERYRILREAEEILLNDAPIAPIAHYVRNYLHHPSVEGWHPLLLDNHPYKHIRLTP